MSWVILCQDAEGAEGVRQSVLPDHVSYMKAAPFPILLAGPLARPDGGGSHGSLIVAGVADRQTVALFISEAPFARNGVWSTWDIYSFAAV